MRLVDTSCEDCAAESETRTLQKVKLDTNPLIVHLTLAYMHNKRLRAFSDAMLQQRLSS